MSDYLNVPGFCVAPFIHSCVWTDGRVIPCCLNQDEVLGDTRTQDIDFIYSDQNEKLRTFRKKLLSGERPESCKRCTLPEESLGVESYRLWLNKTYGHLVNSLGITPDGSVQNSAFAYFDVRFSNLCTLKCRMCDHLNSSAIAAEENSLMGKAHKVLQEPFLDTETFTRFFEENIGSVERIYFCGGEPIILEYHYKLLQLLVDKGRTDVHLKYNSNCTSISFRDKKITDYWKKFSSVCLGMSLDDTGPRAEYIRHGSSWEKILDNLREIRRECPHVTLEWTPTIQVLNVLSVPYLHYELHRENLIDIWFYNLLTDPKTYSIQILPKNLKAEVNKVWSKYIFFLKASGFSSERIQQALEVLQFLELEDHSELLPEFREETRQKDNLRNQSFAEVFPGLRELMET